MKPVKAVDAAFLQLETAATPMHVGALFVLEPGSQRARDTFFRRFKSQVHARLGRSEVFTRRIATLPFNVANPMWVDGDADLDYHVRRTTLPPPGSQHQLEECVADLHAPRMDRGRPLWELHVIEGLAAGRTALYVKTHHAGLDGASAQLFLRSFVDASPRARTGLPRSRPPDAERAGTGELVLAGLRHQATQFARLPRLVSEFAGTAAGSFRGALGVLASIRDETAAAPRTPLNVAITGARTFASVECGLEEVRWIAKTHGATVNDVVLAACAGALRRWLVLHHSLPAMPLMTAVPFSTREPGNTDHSIQVSFMSVNLHTDIAAPRARLKAIHRSAIEAKHGAARTKALVPEDLPSIGLPWLLGGLALAASRPEVIARVPLPTNVVISNVAGPPTTLYVAGARAVTYTPVSIPYHGCALNITVYSYDGRLFFGLTGARNALPDLRNLAEGVRTELARLARKRR